MNGDFINGPLPLWAEIITAVFAVLGAAYAAIGSFGLVRMRTFSIASTRRPSAQRQASGA